MGAPGPQSSWSSHWTQISSTHAGVGAAHSSGPAQPIAAGSSTQVCGVPSIAPSSSQMRPAPLQVSVTPPTSSQALRSLQQYASLRRVQAALATAREATRTSQTRDVMHRRITPADQRATGGSSPSATSVARPPSPGRARRRPISAGTTIIAVRTQQTSPISDARPKPRIARFSLTSSEP